MSNKINGRGFLRRHSCRPVAGGVFINNHYKRGLGICSGGLSMGLLPPMFMWHTSIWGGTQCPFCGGMETVAHIFTECLRLQDLFGLLRELSFLVFGPGYSFPQRHKCCLVNVLFGRAKLAVWLTRRNTDSAEGASRSTDGFQGVFGSKTSCGIWPRPGAE